MILAVLLALKMLTLTFNYVSCSIIFIMIDGVLSITNRRVLKHMKCKTDTTSKGSL